MKLPVLKCKRPGCGHKWVPRKLGDDLPTYCPRCKQRDWNDPKSPKPRKSEAQFSEQTA